MCECEEKIWLVGHGVTNANTGKETLFNVIFQNIQTTVSFNPGVKQAYMTLSRKELIRFRNAINKEIGAEE